MKMKAPKDVSSFAHPEKSYIVPKSGVVDIDDEHVEVAKKHGFAEVTTETTGPTGAAGK